MTLKSLPLPLPAGAARFGGDFLGAAAPFGGRPRPFFAPFSSLAGASFTISLATGSLTIFSAFFGDGFSTGASTFA